MDWIQKKEFQLVKLPDRHYVFHKNNSGSREINVPKTILTKFQARNWLLAHPNAPTRRKRGTKIIMNPNGTYPLGVPGGYMRFSSTKNMKNFLKPLPTNLPFLKPDPTPCDFRSTLKTFEPIGKGRQGIVYFAFNGKKKFAIKIIPRDLLAAKRKEPQPSDVEFKIQKAVCSVAPKGVVNVYDILRCDNFISPNEIDMKNVQNSAHYDKSKQAIISMQWCDGGNLSKKLESLSDSQMLSGVLSILDTLMKIREKYPEFRHNDLHLENVFLNNGNWLIGDFGWSRLKKNGTNPAVNSANGTQTASFWGVGPKTDTRYDHHLLLNEIRYYVMKQPTRYRKTLKFLDRAVPSGYRGEKDIHVSEWRLKYADPCPKLPDIPELLRILPFSEQNLMTAKMRLRKIGKIEKVPSPFIKAENLIRAGRKIRRARVVRPTSLNLQAAKRRLKRLAKTPSPPGWRDVKVPQALLKTNAFNKMVTNIWTKNGKKSGTNPDDPNYFQTAWSKARNVAIEQLKRELALKGPIQPVKKASGPIVLPAIKKAPVILLVKKAKVASPPIKMVVTNVPFSNLKKSPMSGRIKMLGKAGRWVYVDGSTVTLQQVKNLAVRHKIPITGLRSKNEIARKILSAKNK